jgi:hypothetical protein
MPHLPRAHHETSKHDSQNETKMKVKSRNVPNSNSNLAKSMTYHNQTKELTTWFLTRTVAHEVLYRASRVIVITVEHLMGALVTSCPSAFTSHSSGGGNSGGTSQWLVVATGFLVVVVAAALSSSPRVGLAILACFHARYGVPGTTLAHLTAKLKSLATSWMSRLVTFSSIFSSLTPWQNATTTDALEIRGIVLQT